MQKKKNDILEYKNLTYRTLEVLLDIRDNLSEIEKRLTEIGSLRGRRSHYSPK